MFHSTPLPIAVFLAGRRGAAQTSHWSRCALPSTSLPPLPWIGHHQDPRIGVCHYLIIRTGGHVSGDAK